jgi:hypothetical protein
MAVIEGGGISLQSLHLKPEALRRAILRSTSSEFSKVLNPMCFV